MELLSYFSSILLVCILDTSFIIQDSFANKTSLVLDKLDLPLLELSKGPDLPNDGVFARQLFPLIPTPISLTKHLAFHKILKLKNFVRTDDIILSLINLSISFIYSFPKVLLIKTSLADIFRPANKRELWCIYLPLCTLADKTIF